MTPRSTSLRLRWAGLQVSGISLPLTVIAWAGLGLALVALAGLWLDPRVITGAPAWIKPLKFGISTTIYAVTLNWILGTLHGHRRLIQGIGWTVAVMFTLELVLITLQVVRGVRSHFNVGTPFDAILYSTMGAGIVVAWIATVVGAVLVVRQPYTDRALGWSLRLGLLVTLYGASVAFLMTSPTLEQASTMASAAPTVVGAHSVGVADGGPGLPLVGWSTTGGDLRVPHFFGLHAMQIVPAVALALGAFFPHLTQTRRVRLTWIVGLGYLALTLLLTWQALRGQSIVAPDTLTLGAAAALLTMAVLAAWLTLRQHASSA